MGKKACRITGFSITALTAGALLAGCAPPPGGVGSAPQAGGGQGGNAAPETSGSGSSNSDQSGSDQSGSGGSGRSSSSPSSSPSTSKSADKIVVKTGEASGEGEVEPERLGLETAGGGQIDDIEWSSWGGGQAVGKGTLEPHGGGTYKNASITLRIPKTYGGDKQYTRYTISAPGLPTEQANSFKFQPTSHVVEEAEQANEVYVTEGGGPYSSPEQRPVEFSAGGVGHMRMEDVNWTSWNGPTAVGKGTLVLNGCQPSCANANLDVYQNGTVKLTETKDVAGKKQYTKFTMSAPGLPPEQAELLTDQPIE